MKKYQYQYLAAAFISIAIAAGGLFCLELINIDCDQFSCVGYFFILMPFFFFGVILILIVIMAIVVSQVHRLLKCKNKIDEIN